MGELYPGPWIQEVGAETDDAQRAIGFDLITHRVLHESIRDKNEVGGKPAPQCDRYRCQEMIPRTEPLFAPDQCADKRAFQKEREHAFHGQRLSDHTAGVLGKARPVSSELKLHRNAGDDTDRKIEPENLGPKPGGVVVLFITRPQRAPFPINQKPRQPHRELRKKVVVVNLEGELQTTPRTRVGEKRAHTFSLLSLDHPGRHAFANGCGGRVRNSDFRFAPLEPTGRAKSECSTGLSRRALSVALNPSATESTGSFFASTHSRV